MKHKIQINHFLSLIFLFGLILNGLAQTLNPSSISTNGSVKTIVQDNSTIYLGGNFSAAGYKATGIAKINSNSLSEIGFPSVQGQCFSTVQDGSGGWFVGGSFSVQGLSNLIHILANNTIDVSFAPNPNSTVNALYLDGTTLYVGGGFSQISGQTQNRLAAIDASTGVLQNWNPNPDGGVNSITKDANIVYVGGSFQNIGGRQSRNLAAVDATTGLANPFISASSTVTSVEQDATNLYLGGGFSGANGYYTGATSLLTTATDLPDFSFPIISGSITKSISDGSGGWYVGGSFSIQGLSNLIHILANNTIDVSFAPNPNSTVNALYLDGSTLYVGGGFSQISGQAQNRLAAIDASTGFIQNWNPNPDGGVNSITKDANIVYIGGSFQNVGGRQSRNLAAVDATTGLANPFISASSTVTSVEQDATNLYLGGGFSGANGYYT
ncbi:MAG: hypothetical protein K9G36_11710, partial [Crocinitomicaceae bacterium]|nr:hypothetical protein [Crocinitomicaceae bacterium]